MHTAFGRRELGNVVAPLGDEAVSPSHCVRARPAFLRLSSIVDRALASRSLASAARHKGKRRPAYLTLSKPFSRPHATNGKHGVAFNLVQS